MTSYIKYQCDLCLKDTGAGMTLVYKMDGTSATYSLKEKISTLKNVALNGALTVKHICNDCGKEIYNEYRPVDSGL